MDDAKLLSLIEKLKINRENALQFDKLMQFEGIGIRRRIRYLCVFRLINKVLQKDIHAYTQDDVTAFFNFLLNRQYASETKRTTWLIFRKIVKRFVKLKFRPYKMFLKKSKKLPDYLKKHEVLELHSACQTIREKAMIELLYNSGIRPEEFLNLGRPDLTFDAYGLLLNVNGKTGNRIIRVANIIGMDNLAKHYAASNDESLWGISNNRLFDILRRIGLESSLHKRINARMFRHSCATFLSNYLTSAQMEAYFGWTHGSCMTMIYVHLSAKDTSPRIIELNRELTATDTIEYQKFVADSWTKFRQQKQLSAFTIKTRCNKTAIPL